VDFALGTDTGGSVRVPAAFCGLYGMRPSHGRIPLQGVIPFAPSLDTVGWMARSATCCSASVLLPDGPVASHPPRLLAPMDLWRAVAPACAEALWPLALDLGAQPSPVAALDAPLDDWLQAYACLQGDEIRQSLGTGSPGPSRVSARPWRPALPACSTSRRPPCGVDRLARPADRAPVGPAGR
jgi:amidase